MVIIDLLTTVVPFNGLVIEVTGAVISPGTTVGVGVSVGVGIGVEVGVGILVGVGVGKLVGVRIGVGVAVEVGVTIIEVGAGVKVGVGETTTPEHATAFEALIRPCPIPEIGRVSVLFSMHERTSSLSNPLPLVSAVTRANTNAANPATCGEAIDVPERLAYLLPGNVE